jgi:NADPH-dependent glutamate synthase beta subunit-like oxidoreductase
LGISVAIVGSGPSGFYAAEAVLERFADATVDIIDRLPVPYGLIRFGVAPDHAKTKTVAKSYEAIARDPRVRWIGHLEIGRDVRVPELRECYDAVVLATGASTDRKLGIPGDDKQGVVGVAAFVGWYNGHPDFRDLAPPLDTASVVVVGVGNVAVDVARVLVKTPAEMAATDLVEHAAAAIHAAPIRDVHMVGRRGAVQARFTNVELREMGHLKNAQPIVDLAQIPETVPASESAGLSDRDRRLIERNLATLRDFAKVDGAGKAKRVHFRFCASPVAILGGARVEAVRFEETVVVGGDAKGTGRFFEIPCGLVIPAIGYYSEPIPDVPFAKGRTANQDGRIEKGLYAVGWVKRGPSGVIGSNKPDGDAAAEQIKADFPDGGGKPGRAALDDLVRRRGIETIGFDDWKRIEAAEVAAARPGAPRRKFVTVAEMLAARR